MSGGVVVLVELVVSHLRLEMRFVDVSLACQGASHVKARALVNGKESAPSYLRHHFTRITNVSALIHTTTLE